MYKLVALYKMPEDKDVFHSHYQEVHLPICRKIPLLKEMRLSQVFAAPMGEPAFYMQAELCWANKEDFKKGSRSAECAESGKDLMNFAKGLVTVYFAEETVETL